MATKDYSNKQEKMIADYLGWRVVAGSGAAPCHPGDIIGDEWLGECKTHEKSNQPILFKQDVWEKIVEEANKEHRSPVLFTDDGSQKSNRTWCIFPFFRVDDTWSILNLTKQFRTNIIMKLEELNALYPDDSHICYTASFGNHTVAILPLRLFYEMFIQ